MIELEDNSSIKFRKPAMDDQVKTATSTTTSFAVVMPEYTIGTKKKKVIKKTSTCTESNFAEKMLKLSHLEDNEDGPY